MFAALADALVTFASTSPSSSAPMVPLAAPARTPAGSRSDADAGTA
jgi:hypothetical protein